MQVDFYQLSRDPVEVALAQIAGKALPAGQRLLVVADDEALLKRVSDALWAQRKESFLPNAMAGGEHDARQPILLATELAGPAVNGASVVAFADGVWREPEGFARALLLFDEARLVPAREEWRRLGSVADVSRAFWKQDGGRWVKAG
jgi:DNA polymerase-3 subunit chi